jgi:hypothetical protein
MVIKWSFIVFADISQLAVHSERFPMIIVKRTNVLLVEAGEFSTFLGYQNTKSFPVNCSACYVFFLCVSPMCPIFPRLLRAGMWFKYLILTTRDTEDFMDEHPFIFSFHFYIGFPKFTELVIKTSCNLIA